VNKNAYKRLGYRSLREAQVLLDTGHLETTALFAYEAIGFNLMQFIEDSGHSLPKDREIAALYEIAVTLGGLSQNEEDAKMISLFKTYRKINYPEGYRELDEKEAAEAVGFAKELTPAIKWGSNEIQ